MVDETITLREMTKVRQHFESRGTRLITIPRENEIDKYNLGEVDYSRCGVECQSISSIDRLYEKLCCGKYEKNEENFREEIYPVVHEQAKNAIESDTLGVTRDSLEKALKSLFHKKIYEEDYDFRDHVNNNNPGPKSKTPGEDVKKGLAEIWLVYIAERGVDY